MTRKTKIIIACIVVLVLAVLSVVVYNVVKMNSVSKMTVDIHNALETKDVSKLCECIVRFDKNERNIELEGIITKEIEKVYESENYEGIIFAESLMKNLATKAMYVKPALSYCEQLKKIPLDYKYAKQKAYMKGYWVRTDNSAYENMVIIVAGKEEGLAANIRTVAPNLEGYAAGGPLWSGVEMYEEYKFSVNVLSKTKNTPLVYKKSFGTLNMDKGIITISADGKIQNWRKAAYEEIKEMSYDYGAYKGSKWVSEDNPEVTLEITQSIGDKLSFEVYNSTEDVKLIVSNITVTDGTGDFDSGDGGDMVSGTLRLKGQKINVTFIGNDMYPDGDYILQ